MSKGIVDWHVTGRLKALEENFLLRNFYRFFSIEKISTKISSIIYDH